VLAVAAISCTLLGADDLYDFLTAEPMRTELVVRAGFKFVVSVDNAEGTIACAARALDGRSVA
jgi:hypothetical protein